MQQSRLPAFSGRTVKIFGTAGSGKTTRLMELLSEEIRSGTPSERIGFLTYTKTATKVANARAGVTLEWGRTAHAACYRAAGLSRHEVMSREDDAILAKMGFPLVGERSYGAINEAGQYREGYDACLYAMSIARNTGRKLSEVVAELAPQYDVIRPYHVKRFRDAYVKIKRERGKRDFDDMLDLIALQGKPLDLDVLFLDETQDFSLLMWRAIHVLGANAKRVYMAGDDDQSIFSFLGADEYGFLDHPCDEEVVLRTSHRCARSIGAYAEKVIRRVHHRKEKAVDWRDGPGGVEVGAPISSDLARAEADMGRSVMWLARHRAGVRRESDKLLEAGVPHKVGGEAVNDGRWAWAVKTYIRLRRGEEMPTGEVASMLETLNDRSGARALRQEGGGTLRREHLEHAMSFDQPWHVAFWTRKRERRINGVMRMLKAEGLEVLGRKPLINISTMHASKGEEADVVFITADCNARAYENVLRGVPSELRLAYVALTRARHRVTIGRAEGMNELRTLYP